MKHDKETIKRRVLTAIGILLVLTAFGMMFFGLVPEGQRLWYKWFHDKSSTPKYLMIDREEAK